MSSRSPACMSSVALRMMPGSYTAPPHPGLERDERSEPRRPTRTIRLQASEGPLRACSARRLADLLAAGADHRLDEGAVGILVAALHQFRERLEAVRALVVGAGQIERKYRVVRGADHVEPLEARLDAAHG